MRLPLVRLRSGQDRAGKGGCFFGVFGVSLHSMSKKILSIILIVVILMCAAGATVGGWWYLKQRKNAEQARQLWAQAQLRAAQHDWAEAGALAEKVVSEFGQWAGTWGIEVNKESWQRQQMAEGVWLKIEGLVKESKYEGKKGIKSEFSRKN